MFVKFKRFLKDAGLIARNQLTDFAQLIGYHGWESDTALGLMLVNLAMDNPQIAWYMPLTGETSFGSWVSTSQIRLAASVEKEI